MIAYPDCVACGGTGTSSRGRQCVPCQNRRMNHSSGPACPELAERRKLSKVEAGKAELLGLIRMMKAQNEPEPREETREETREEVIERKKREMRRLLERMLS